MTSPRTLTVRPSTTAPGWVDEILLGGDDADVCLWLDAPVDRQTLRAQVRQREEALVRAGLTDAGTVALRMPPSLAYIANLLAAWRIGARVVLLDHRLTRHEVDAAVDRIQVQLMVEIVGAPNGPLRGYHTVSERIVHFAGEPARTPHALIQLSSGSTGPSKVIGRTAADLVEEIDRYARMEGVPRGGERIVLLASMVHVLGLVGGLLYGLHAGAQLVLPERLTAAGILSTVADGDRPTTLLGVPSYLELLARVEQPRPLPQLVRITTGGELVRPGLAELFTRRYGAVVGNMYGMTEVGVIATDLFGEHRPALVPAPGIEVRISGGQLHVRRPQTPYVGLADGSRWTAGWLRTNDAATMDGAGRVTILGRLDSQVGIGGLKVDLTEVEQAIAGLPGVAETVVAFDGAIEGYLVLGEPATVAGVEQALAERLAPYKRPRRWHVLDRIPRTASGKLVRDIRVLRAAAERAAVAR